ncbi:MAG TPA: MaoC/PaaZ C-terminal domain-containing protein [Solirubrobacteraceae bacterium]|jgi:acyl dehydratase|nr:MaoC/PaaZ C-terminal domain-containing protein [Solirubrobacteraceae bacterium]
MTSTVADPLVLGARLTGGSRTVTDVEIALLPAIMGAISPLFHDEETARRSSLGRRVLYGPALLGIAIACTEPLLHGRVIALAGITDVRFRAPVGVGDTVTASLTVTELRSKPEKPGDLLLVEDQVHNQHGELVLEFRRAIMIRRDAP